MEIKWIGSPHKSSRNGYSPIAIVIHIMEGTMNGADAWFNNPNSKVSTHYGVGKDGSIHQYVNEEEAAWGNGVVDRPTWVELKANINPNLYTISIEHEGKTGEKWTDAMYKTDVELINQICSKWNIPKDRSHIIGHYEICKSKANCPGAGFDFDKLLGMLKPSVDESKKNTEVENLKTKISELENRNAFLSNELSTIKNEQNETRKKYIAKVAEFNKLKEDMDICTADAAKYIEENNDLEKQKQILIKQNQITGDQRDEFKQKYEELVKELQAEKSYFPNKMSLLQRIKNFFFR